MEKYSLPLEMFYQHENGLGDRVYLRQPIAGTWNEYTWRSAGNQARRMAAHLRAQNFPPGSHIAILSKNCAHWLMADLAIWMAGHTSVPLYPNLTASTVAQILEHSESRLLFVGKLDDWPGMKPGVSGNLPCISFPYQSPTEFRSWDRVIEGVAPISDNPTRAATEIATVIYTSGTTGQPKGVVHPFQSFAMAGTEITKVIGLNSSDRYFSYLPLAHVAERLLTETLGLYSGGTVWFAESLEKFAENLREASPTVFLGVPRIWTKFQGGVLAKLPQKKLNRLLSIPIISMLIRRKIKKALGLADCRFAVTGAAPIPVALLDWYRNLGIVIQEAYGLTENFAYSHYNPKEAIRLGTVGINWPKAETKLGENGEVLVKSLCTMKGYYKEADLTAETIKDGFLCTGDQGEIDSDGYLKITGRVKDLFKTSKGKYVVPGPIEKKLGNCALLEQTCLVGSGLPQPLALAVLSEPARAMEQRAVRTTLESILTEININLDPHERVAKIVITRDPWGIENGLLTPTMKVKRNAVEKRYGTELETWMGAKDTVVWQT